MLAILSCFNWVNKTDYKGNIKLLNELKVLFSKMEITGFRRLFYLKFLEYLLTYLNIQ